MMAVTAAISIAMVTSGRKPKMSVNRLSSQSKKAAVVWPEGDHQAVS